MIIENGLSRIFLGVHWSFDAFKIRPNGNINVARNIGGVPLGLKIAEDIFSSGMKKSNVGAADVALEPLRPEPRQSRLGRRGTRIGPLPTPESKAGYRCWRSRAH